MAVKTNPAVVILLKRVVSDDSSRDSRMRKYLDQEGWHNMLDINVHVVPRVVGYCIVYCTNYANFGATATQA